MKDATLSSCSCALCVQSARANAGQTVNIRVQKRAYLFSFSALIFTKKMQLKQDHRFSVAPMMEWKHHRT